MSKQYPLNVPAPHHFTYAVRDLPEVTVEQRERALQATHYNEFAFPSGMLTVDMLSDSGTTAIISGQACSSATRLTAATPVITFCSTPSATSSSAAARRTGRRSSTSFAPIAATLRR